MNKQETQLREIVKQTLESITKSGSPFFYEMVFEQNSFDKAEEMLITYAIKNRVTISAALGLIESEMSN